MDFRILNDGYLLVDRLTTLPNELLIRILSLLPTKEAAVMCVLSQRMRRLFPCITSLDFDASFISHCCKHPYALQQFPSFIAFVNTVLRGHQSPCLTKFRLQVGVDFRTRRLWHCIQGGRECFPDLKYSQINAWISFALTRCGLRELDLRLQMRQPDDCQLPPEIFRCETLEVLKLDVNLNLGFDRVSLFRLPNLKTLHLYAPLISEDNFLTRLVSSCPVLEDLTVEAYFQVSSISISSLSLQRLYLMILKINTSDIIDLVHIDTPNLKYFFYHDHLPIQYSLQNMHSPVKAVIGIPHFMATDGIDASHQQMLNLITALSTVQHMSLLYLCTWLLNFVEVKDQLPLFPNLKCLELSHFGVTFWDKVLIAFLNHSPILETLIFPEGLIDDGNHFNPLPKCWRKSLELEQEFCRTPLDSVPQCCRSHLKKIVIKNYFGNERELNLIQFLLRHALVLEELVIFPFSDPSVDRIQLQSSLRELRKASISCSIQLQVVQ